MGNTQEPQTPHEALAFYPRGVKTIVDRNYQYVGETLTNAAQTPHEALAFYPRGVKTIVDRN